MIGYVTLGTTDVSRAAAFYDGVLGEMNTKCVMEEDGFVACSQDGSSPMLSVITPFNGERATVGNGVMVALVVRARDQVARLHAKALAMGGADEGAPGLREETFYGAYLLDLDGHKVAIYTADFFLDRRKPILASIVSVSDATRPGSVYLVNMTVMSLEGYPEAVVFVFAQRLSTTGGRETHSE